MDKQLLFKIVEELRLQSRLALYAYQSLKTHVQAVDQEKIIFSIEGLLFHASQVSRLLWPVRQESSARGDQLRAELKVDAESPLRLREVRSEIERPDERLEDWIAGLEQKNYLELNLMPRGTIADYKQDSFQRSLDPETMRLHFRGDSCDLRKVADELRRLEGAIQQWLKTHQPW